MQRRHGEWRVSPLDDPERKVSAPALMTEVDWRTPGCKTCQDVRYHKGWHYVHCRERVLPPTVPDTMCPVASTKRLLDTGADDARDDHESKRHKNSDDSVPMAQEPHGPRLCVCQAQMRLYVCQALPLPNTKCVYMCVTKCVYMCVTKCVYMCVTAFICVSPNAFIYMCHQMCLLMQWSSLRSLAFARFARTFFNSLN